MPFELMEKKLLAVYKTWWKWVQSLILFSNPFWLKLKLEFQLFFLLPSILLTKLNAK